jgi:hypothetical protein
VRLSNDTKYIYILQTEQIAKADSVNNVMRQWNTSYQHASIFSEEQYIKIHDKVCALLRVNIYKGMRIKLHNEQ